MIDRTKEYKFSKSTAKSKFIGGGNLSMSSTIEMQETCSLCENSIPDGRLVLRHEYTHNIICVFCVVGLAEVN